MTLLLRALLLGYGGAALGSAWLQGWAGTWIAVLVAWIGGGVLTLVFTGIGVWLWPEPEGTRPASTADRRISRPERERAAGHAEPASPSMRFRSALPGSG